IRRQVLIHIRDLSLLVVAATLASFGASLFLSSLLTRPLVRLAEGAKAVGRGDLSQKVPVEAADELGDLANSFNTMTDDLVRSRDDLMRRNTELRNLNSMADHLSQHLAPEEIPESSLGKLLQMTGLRAGWICIMGDNGRLRPAGGNGGPPKAPPKAPPKGSGAGGCLCYQALQSSQGVVTPGVPECPPLKGRSVGKSKTVSASVPLSAQEETLGVLTVSADSPGVLDGDFVQFLRSVGQQIGVGLRNARLDREVRQKEEARGRLLDKLIVAQEEERKRIAREIHDEPAQTLTAIAMRLDQMKRHLPDDQIEVRQGLEEAHQEAKKAMEVLYQIIVELRPQALDDLGFLPAIRWHAGLRLGEKGINLEFHASGSPARLDSQIETAVFRLMQEAINNIYRHSGAKHAKIRLYFRKAAIKGIIEDDGVGFDVAAMRTPRMDSPGLGLMGMEERASILGGSLTLTSRPGKGTRVVFEVPLNAGGAQHAEQD
ncbi:MAG: HAMP domain-containing protein, partial [Dehalococcoidia bacterium]